MTHTIAPPTGVERIARLEERVDRLDAHMTELVASTKAIESILLQGRGAFRVAHWLIGAIGFVAAGYFGHAGVSDFLKWAGR